VKMHAKFTTTLRGEEVVATIDAVLDVGKVELNVELTKDGKPYPIELTRDELANLCREAGRSQRQ